MELARGILILICFDFCAAIFLYPFCLLSYARGAALATHYQVDFHTSFDYNDQFRLYVAKLTYVWLTLTIHIFSEACSMPK